MSSQISPHIFCLCNGCNANFEPSPFLHLVHCLLYQLISHIVKPPSPVTPPGNRKQFLHRLVQYLLYELIFCSILVVWAYILYFQASFFCDTTGRQVSLDQVSLKQNNRFHLYSPSWPWVKFITIDTIATMFHSFIESQKTSTLISKFKHKIDKVFVIMLLFNKLKWYNFWKGSSCYWQDSYTNKMGNGAIFLFFAARPHHFMFVILIKYQLIWL